MSNKVEPEVQRAWDYHREADNLLHNRVESFFIAQAFLIAAYVLLVTEDKDGLFKPLGQCVVLLGLAVTIAVLWLNGAMIKRIEFLKRHYLQRDRVYQNYMRGALSDKPGRASEGLLRYILPVAIPCLFILFWAYCLVWRESWFRPDEWIGWVRDQLSWLLRRGTATTNSD